MDKENMNVFTITNLHQFSKATVVCHLAFCLYLYVDGPSDFRVPLIFVAATVRFCFTWHESGESGFLTFFFAVALLREVRQGTVKGIFYRWGHLPQRPITCFGVIFVSSPVYLFFYCSFLRYCVIFTDSVPIM